MKKSKYKNVWKHLNQDAAKNIDSCLINMVNSVVSAKAGTLNALGNTLSQWI